MKHRLTAPLLAVLVLALAAFTGSALAGGGQGNGGGSSNGNSANAPGQTQQAPAAPAAAPATAPGQAKKATTAPAAPSTQSSKQSSTSASSPATGGSNANGVKPSSTTKHDTYAKASSDQTKKYGNGKTAGQIATQAGYGDATLHGPGNSQPHKAAPCPGSKREVDVHALKNKSSKCTTSQSTQNESKKTNEQTSQGVAASAKTRVTICHATGSSSNPYVRISPSASGVFHGHLGHQDGRDIVPPFTWNGTTYSENWTDAGMAIYNAGCTVSSTSSATLTPLAPATLTPLAPATLTPLAPATQTPATVAPATTAAGSVLGTQATITPAASSPAASPAVAGGVKGAVVALKPTKTKPAGGVLGTTTRLGGTIASTRLPFTGLPLWIFALVAAGLIGIGLTMRRVSANRI